MDTKTPGNTGMKPIEIFRPGTFTAMNGTKCTFSAAQVQELADTYKPEFSDAPLVVGHPKLTSPRYGHAGKLFINAAGVLCADAADVVPEFAAAVAAKMYTNVSASIYMPDAPGNPTPGKHYLRHIGFLGGAAPAVKGLKSVEFSADETGIADFSYSDRIVVQIFRRIREWIIETSGIDAADAIVSDYQLSDLADSNTRDELESSKAYAAFSDPNQPTEAELSQQKDLDAQSAKLIADRAELDNRAAKVAEQETAIKKAGHAEFAEGLCTSGQLLPAQKASVVEILSQLDTANQVADFAATDADHGKTGAELFKAFLSAQPKQVEFRRVSPTAVDGANTAIVDFALPAGCVVDAEGLDTYRRAQEYQKTHPGTDLITAAKAVS
jgi:hypothetical protein